MSSTCAVFCSKKQTIARAEKAVMKEGAKQTSHTPNAETFGETKKVTSFVGIATPFISTIQMTLNGVPTLKIGHALLLQLLHPFFCSRDLGLG